jgi:hypothetical protein
LMSPAKTPRSTPKPNKGELAKRIFDLVASAQARGGSAEELLRTEVLKRERSLRRSERALAGRGVSRR